MSMGGCETGVVALFAASVLALAGPSLLHLIRTRNTPGIIAHPTRRCAAAPFSPPSFINRHYFASFYQHSTTRAPRLGQLTDQEWPGYNYATHGRVFPPRKYLIGFIGYNCCITPKITLFLRRGLSRDHARTRHRSRKRRFSDQAKSAKHNPSGGARAMNSRDPVTPASRRSANGRPLRSEGYRLHLKGGGGVLQKKAPPPEPIGCGKGGLRGGLAGWTLVTWRTLLGE